MVPESLLEIATPLLITFNEAPNLERTLRQLKWAQRIVVIDSFSTDETLDILRSHSQIDVYQRKFDSFASQCNFGLEKIKSEWVLSIDADYVLTDNLIKEIQELPANTDKDAFVVRFKYCVWGRSLRGTLYPPRKVLYRRRKANYIDDGHAHHVSVLGSCTHLASFIHHDDRKPLSRWTASQAKYVEAETVKFSGAVSVPLSFNDRLRKMKVLAPVAVLLYCLILHRGLLDGWPGWYYAFQRSLAEILLALSLIKRDNLLESGDIARWVRKQNNLATVESRRLHHTSLNQLTFTDRIRRLKVLAPVLMLPYALLIRGDFFSGWQGWHRAYRKTFFELLLAIHLIESEHIIGSDRRNEEKAGTS